MRMVRLEWNNFPFSLSLFLYQEYDRFSEKKKKKGSQKNDTLIGSVVVIYSSIRFQRRFTRRLSRK